MDRAFDVGNRQAQVVEVRENSRWIRRCSRGLLLKEGPPFCNTVWARHKQPVGWRSGAERPGGKGSRAGGGTGSRRLAAQE
ncbi:MAG: hypothetical protein Ct9H300mP1_14490 [Planctomycetaceae bacterium]|nr:MAG: hypothetical protein Ct9H300mP1_14490 [Planctomycetaceae bacterium]